MSEENVNKTEFQLYRRRWFVLAALALLNIGNNILWISYAAVADVTGKYFEAGTDEVDLLGTVSFIVGVPTCLISTYIVDRYGLRVGLNCGSILTVFGGILRAISTIPGFQQESETPWWNLETQYYISLVGQALTGIGNPFAVSLPTKVSQNWFGENERGMATSLLALSLPLGIALGQGCSPLFVKEGNDIPLMNVVWLIPAVITQVLVTFTATASHPPIPPSMSAKLAKEAEKGQTFKEYLNRMKSIFTNKEYMILFITIGGAVGYFNVFSTQLSQFMCSRGYDNVSSGLAGSLLLGTGFVGAIASGWFVEKYGYIEEVAKIFYGIAGIMGILIGQFMRHSDQKFWIMFFCAMFGIFGFGMYPLGLELSVEVTYPLDESIGTALIFMSGQLQGFIMVMVSAVLEQDLSAEEEEKAVCLGSVKPKDHTRFIIFLSCFLTCLNIFFILIFKTKFKRSNADKTRETSSEANEKLEDESAQNDNLGFENDNDRPILTSL